MVEQNAISRGGIATAIYLAGEFCRGIFSIAALGEGSAWWRYSAANWRAAAKKAATIYSVREFCWGDFFGRPGEFQLQSGTSLIALVHARSKPFWLRPLKFFVASLR
jgi:hypothetical protein